MKMTLRKTLQNLAARVRFDVIVAGFSGLSAFPLPNMESRNQSVEESAGIATSASERLELTEITTPLQLGTPVDPEEKSNGSSPIWRS